MALRKYIDVLINADGTAKTKEPLYVFHRDRNLELYFKLIDYKYKYSKGTVSEDILNMIYTLEGTSAWITLISPTGAEIERGNGVTLDNVIVEKSYVKFILTEDLTDEITEIGTYKLQIHIVDDVGGEFTIPPINFEVKERVKGTLQPNGVELLTDENNNLNTESGINIMASGTGVKISDLPLRATMNGQEHFPVVINGITYKMPTSQVAKASHTHTEYANKTHSHTKSEITDFPTIPSKTSQLTNDSTFASESFVTTKIAEAQLGGGSGNIDLSGYATKEELATKSNVGHTHNEYLTEHQDISGKVDKVPGKSLILDTEITKLNGITDSKITKWDTAYNHSTSTHAPSTAQKNSDITKAEIEAKLTGEVSSHTHNYEPVIAMKGTAFNKNFGTGVGEVAEGNHGHTGYASTGQVEANATQIAEITQQVNDHITNHPSGGETHTHSNKVVLDGITQEKVNKWDSNVSENINTIEPLLEDIPKIFFTSDTILSLVNKASGEAMCEFEYISKTKKLKCYGTVAVQGTTSATFPKKNYTLKLYKDIGKSEKEYMNLKNWGNQTKFCLKANYVDTTHTRNLAGARIGFDMVESRPTSEFKTALQTSPRNGLVDGFPIKVFVNGLFHGIYTWNIPKDSWQFNMSNNNQNHCVLCAELNTGTNPAYSKSCQFREVWGGEADTSWSVEVGNATTEIVNSFNNAINHVMSTSDSEFKSNISNFFDLDSLLDYYCFSYLCCHYDGLAKNLLMATYDGIHWGASLYDMDSIFGATYDGSSFMNTNRKCPEEYQENLSLLWERIEICFPQELYTRYKELRKGALSLGNIVSHVEEIYDLISDRDIKEEQDKWTGLPSKATNTIKRFRDYMYARAVYVDSEFEAFNINPIPITNLSIKSATTVANGGTETLIVTYTPIDTTQKGVVWTSDNENIATVVNGVVSGISNGSCVITATSSANPSLKSACNVIVETINIPVLNIGLDKYTSNLDVGKEITLTATFNPTNATNKNVTWNIDNSNCTIVQNGLTCTVRGVSEGESIITVTSEDGSKTANCNITVLAGEVEGYIKLTLTGDEMWEIIAWENHVNKNFYPFEIQLNKTINGFSYEFPLTTTNSICNSMTIVSQETGFNNPAENIYSCVYASNNMLTIEVSGDKLITKDAAGFKAWLSSNNITIYIKKK